MHLKKVFTTIAFFFFFSCFSAAFAQDYVHREEMNQMKKEMGELKALVGELKTIIKQQNKTIKSLQEHAREDEHSPRHASAGEEHDEPGKKHVDTEKLDLHDIFSSIKPSVNVAGDFVANVADDNHMRTEDDRFSLRGVDIIFSGEIDNVAKASVNLAYHDDDVVLEEGYLDVYDFLPFHTDLRLGKFRVNFGLLNTVHPHGLPQVDYPAIYREYLGHEGHIDEGVGIAGEFPSLWGTAFQYTLQAVNGNRHEHGDDDEHNEHDDHDNHLYTRMKDYDNIVYIARLQNKFKLADTFAVKWGLSGLAGKFEAEDEAPRYWLSGGDLTLTWSPFDERYKRIRSQTELFSSQIEDHSSWERAYGLYSFLDYRFAKKWLIGARFDYVQLALDSDDRRSEYSGYLTHNYSENNQIRLQVKSSHRNYEKDTNEVFLQWVFTLGRHEHGDEEDH